MLAIIPARGGSKGILKKNIKLLGGKPLILWTIESALASRKIDRIILSTDDEEIVEVCSETGVEIPFMRPSELAKDDSLAIDNYIYTIKRLETEFGEKYEDFLVLQPTTPFRKVEDIDGSIELFHNKKANSVISCVKLNYPFGWILTVNDEGKIKKVIDVETSKAMNRQSLEDAYLPNGSISIYKSSLLLDNYTYYSKKTYAYLMPSERSIDIDTEFDLKLAEFIIKEYNFLKSKSMSKSVFKVLTD